MDDDLRAVATLLASAEPTAEAVGRSRRRLRNRMQRPPRRRTSWRATGVALTAAAAVGAIVVTAVATAPTAGRHAPRGQASPTRHAAASGRQVLLAAATSAERAPATSGRYWHVSLVITDEAGHVTHRSDTWDSRDGSESWKRGDTTGNRLVRQHTPVRYDVGLRHVTAAQLAKLPTGPAELRAWLEYSAAHGDVRTPDGKPDRFAQRDAVVHSLAALVSGLPAPPAVRAAAFRALASFPGVVDLGPADGGRAIRVPGAVEFPGIEPRMVVDPDTGMVRNTTFFSSGDGSENYVVPGSKATVLGEWTDIRPR